MFKEAEGIRPGAGTDNQHATWLHIDPNTGFAPPNWQGGIGTMVVAAADGKPLNTQVLGAITDYVSNILDAFGDGGVPTAMYPKARLDTFIARHLQMQTEYQSAQMWHWGAMTNEHHLVE